MLLLSSIANSRQLFTVTLNQIIFVSHSKVLLSWLILEMRKRPKKAIEPSFSFVIRGHRAMLRQNNIQEELAQMSAQMSMLWVRLSFSHSLLMNPLVFRCAINQYSRGCQHSHLCESTCAIIRLKKVQKYLLLDNNSDQGLNRQSPFRAIHGISLNLVNCHPSYSHN